jgi:putative transposase
MLCPPEARSLRFSCGSVHDSRRSAVTLPLCARYFSVTLDTLDVCVQGDDGPDVHSVQWAMGVLADGELEMLGAWLSTCDDARLGQQLFADLRCRGVEAVRFFISADSAANRVDELAAYPRAKVLPSFEALLRESLLQVAPSHRAAVGSALRLLTAAESLESAELALDTFAAGALGRRYPALVDRWHRALVDSRLFFALGPRHRRLLLLWDEFVRESHVRLQRALSRPGSLPSSQRVTSLVEAALSRIGHSLPRQRRALGRDAVGHSVRPMAGPLAACP